MVEDWSSVLFVGWDDVEGVTFYRSFLPAQVLGAEYVVFDPSGRGVARSGSRVVHDVAVMQHCWQLWQLRIARRMRSLGMKTIINVDDWVPGIKNMGDSHAYHSIFAKRGVADQYEQLLRDADGVVCATPWLVDRCRVLNPNVALARNGLDLERYKRFRRLSENPYPVLGWAGGTGHVEAFKKIIPAVVRVMEKHPDVRLHIVGDDLSSLLPDSVRDRVRYFEWSDKYFYPRHLASFDVNLAPALERDFYKAKSQLRFYEACAMGTPTVGHPMYSEIADSFAGLIANSLDDWYYDLCELVERPDVRRRMARRALDYAELISIEARAGEWKKAITSLTSP